MNSTVQPRPWYRRVLSSMAQWFDTSVEPEGSKPGEPNRVDYVRSIPFWGMHLMCLGVIWVGWSWTAVLSAVALYWIRMFAITGFYHRYFSHRTFRTSRTVQFCFALLGCTATQKGPLWWAAHHRHHHLYSDQENDAHSPIQHGFWWSHMLWFSSMGNFRSNHKTVPDLAKFPELRFLDRFDMLVPVLFGVSMFLAGRALEAFAPGLGTNGTQMLIWAYFISTVVLAHGTFTVNSLTHIYGTRRFETGEGSRNNWFVALITLGEGWHNNHHHYQATVRQGFVWWEIDITYYLLKAMSWVGLIWELKPIPEKVLRELEPKKEEALV